MNVKILKVFYGTDTLPYKDKARTIHFPIVGQSFLGASNTTEIRFYFEQLGDDGANATYIASAKLPNGKHGYKLLTKVYDNEEEEWYARLQLSSFFTQAKGDLYVSLRGYNGGAEIIYDSEDEIYKVEGDPIIQGTGSIKLSINYAVPYQQGSEDEEISLEDIYAEIGTKLSILSNDYISIVDDISSFVLTPDFAEYPNEHIFLDRAKRKFYQKTSATTYSLYDFSNYYYVATASTTFAELASVGHSILVSYGTKEYLMFSSSYTLPNFYDFSIIDLNVAGQVFSSKGDIYISPETLFSSIVDESNNSLKINFVEQSHSSNVVYGTDNSGNQATIPISVNVENSNIVRRGSSGQIYARQTPTENNEVVRKEYTDSFAKDLVVSIDPSTYEVSFILKDKNGNTLASQEIDLPLESVIVNGYYDDDNKEIILVLDNGSEIEIPVSDIIAGLVNEDDLADTLQSYVLKSTKIAGIDLQDDITKDELNNALSNLVELEHSGDTLSDSDYAKATKDNGVILFNDNYFYKTIIQTGQIVYTSPKFTITSNTGYKTIAKEAISVNTSTKVASYGTVSFNIYDKGQMDTLLATKQDNLTFDSTPTAGSSNPVTSSGIKNAIDSAVSRVYRYLGTLTIAQINALDTSELVIGDVYNVSDAGTLTEGDVQVIAGDNVAWTGTEWDKLANDIDWDTYNETFLAAGFIQAGPVDSVPEQLTFDSEGNITNPDWTGNIALDYMSPPISDISISDVPATLTFDVTQDYDNMITNADWTGIMTITY